MTKGSGLQKRACKQAFQALYAIALNPPEDEAGIRNAFLFSAHGQKIQDEASEPAGPAWDLTRGVMANEKALDEALQKYSHNWRLDRMGKIELVLLRLGLYEILYGNAPAEDITKQILHLGRDFGAGNSLKFIKGVLDSVAQDNGR